MSEKEKTILFVVLAFVFMCGCIVTSCCAVSMFILSRADRNTIIDILNNSTNSDISYSAGNQSESDNYADQTNLDVKDENGLSEAESRRETCSCLPE